jgi:hypothetical protein
MNLRHVMDRQARVHEEMRDRIGSEAGPEAAQLPAELKRRRREEIGARIERLERRRAEMTQRFEEAIAAEKAALEQLDRDISWEGDRPKVERTDPPPSGKPGRRKRGDAAVGPKRG